MTTQRVVTHAEVAALPDGGALFIDDNTVLTPLAKERVAARNIQVQRGGQRPASAVPIEEVTERILARIGPVGGATAQRVAEEVAKALLEHQANPQGSGLPPAADYCAALLSDAKHHAHRRCVLTTTGKNQRGIVALFTTIMADHGADILDISQTLVGGYFTMLLIADIDGLQTNFEALKQAILSAAASRSVQAIVMHEDIVAAMHRV